MFTTHILPAPAIAREDTPTRSCGYGERRNVHHKLEFEDEVYQPSDTFSDAVKIDEPWGIDIPLARLRPRNM
jgi:hypothetical protein